MLLLSQSERSWVTETWPGQPPGPAVTAHRPTPYRAPTAPTMDTLTLAQGLEASRWRCVGWGGGTVGKQGTDRGLPQDVCL